MMNLTDKGKDREPEKNKKGLEAEKLQMIRARQWACALCQYAGAEEGFLEEFWDALVKDGEVFEEFCYYMDYQKFLCKVKVRGSTVVDVMIWQIDHFKAELDRGNYEMKNNGDKMLLMAFHTFLKMRKEPWKYTYAIQEETGTDYPEKF